MAFTAPAASGGNYQLPPADSHVARLVKLIDMGTTMNEMYNKKQHKMAWAFELVNCMMAPDEDGKIKPFLVYEFLTLSMNEKANLRKRIESWRGVAFASDEEAEAYPIDQLLGKPCYITIIHGKKKNGNDRADISSLIKLPRGLTAKEPQNELVFFHLENFNQTIFDSFSDGMKNSIAKSDEYLAIKGGYPVHQAQSLSDDFDDDIPF